MELERRSPQTANAFTILGARVEACSRAGAGPSDAAEDNRLDRRLHDSKLGELGKREKVFASAEAASLRKATASWLIFQKSPAGVGFFVDTLLAILAKRVCEEMNKWPDMNFLEERPPRVRVYGRIRENSRTTKTNKG
jgi:hypothetical protein